jgi:hypothetical protein
MDAVDVVFVDVHADMNFVHIAEHDPWRPGCVRSLLRRGEIFFTPPVTRGVSARNSEFCPPAFVFLFHGSNQ